MGKTSTIENNFIYIKPENLYSSDRKILTLVKNTVCTLLFDIPFTFFEKIPIDRIKYTFYNLWTITPAILIGAPYCFINWLYSTSLESLFLNSLLPTATPAINLPNNPTEAISEKINNCTFYKLISKEPNAKTVVFFPGRHGSFHNNRASLNKLFTDRNCNIITWDPPKVSEKKSVNLNVTFNDILQGSEDFLSYLEQVEINGKKLDAGNTIFYAYSLGGLFLNIMLKNKDMLTRFEKSSFVVERSFCCLKQALDETAKRCFPIKLAMNRCNKSIFSSELFKEYALNDVLKEKDLNILHLPAYGDFTISENSSSQTSNSASKCRVRITSASLIKYSSKELLSVTALLILNLVIFNPIFSLCSIFLSTMHFVYKNPCYFNTHAMDYGFSTEEVCDDLGLEKVSKKNNSHIG